MNCELILTYDTPALRQTGSRNLNVFGPIRFLLPVCRLCWFLFTLNIYAHFSSHFSQQLLMAEICAYMFNVYRNQLGQQTGSRNPTGPKTLPTIWHTYMKLLPSVQDIFRRIFLSNCWWQKSDIWSQASYRYTILWVAFLDPSDSYFLFADFVDFYTHWTYMLIFRRILLSNYWWQKSDIWSQGRTDAQR
jgi:hypothetical protein